MVSVPAQEFVAEPGTGPAVQGWLHPPLDNGGVKAALVLTHGAGSNAEATSLVRIAEHFAAAGWLVLRVNLPFRQARASGSPHAGDAARDREGLRRAVEAVAGMPGVGPAPVVLSGHSYGGRQASMLVADQPGLVRALLLFSYPLHPPGRADQMRTAHFPRIAVPAVFVHGTRDPFASEAELSEAVRAIPGPVELVRIEGAGHDLRAPKKAQVDVPDAALRAVSAVL
jgi:uncharacterized protein